jgi:hypothetical protein
MSTPLPHAELTVLAAVAIVDGEEVLGNRISRPRSCSSPSLVRQVAWPRRCSSKQPGRAAAHRRATPHCSPGHAAAPSRCLAAPLLVFVPLLLATRAAPPQGGSGGGIGCGVGAPPWYMWRRKRVGSGRATGGWVVGAPRGGCGGGRGSGVKKKSKELTYG